ncbi:hypothetical protein [Streptomyces sp. NPDC001315]|uniref:hypothetical protein n=1 Tax=Streptomyces sp. NPDC001315 TaxID=3364562 RepID=UPI0036AFD77E
MDLKLWALEVTIPVPGSGGGEGLGEQLGEQLGEELGEELGEDLWLDPIQPVLGQSRGIRSPICFDVLPVVNGR